MKFFDSCLRNVWLGISDHDSPGTMAWIDGDYVGYTNWAIGEPDKALIN